MNYIKPQYIGTPQAFTEAEEVYAAIVYEGDNAGLFVMLRGTDGNIATIVNGKMQAEIFLVPPTPDRDIACFELEQDAQRLVEQLNRYAEHERKSNDRFRVQSMPSRKPVS